MGLINPDLSGIVDGSVGDAADWITPMNTIINVINGGLDTNNFTAAGTNLATIAQGVAWASYSPTWTNLTKGNGTDEGLYIQIGKLVWFRVGIQFGSTTSVSGSIQVSLPITAKNYAATLTSTVATIGMVNLRDDSSGNEYPADASYANTTTINIFAGNASGAYTTMAPVAQTVPFTWAVSDGIYIQGFYEAA